MAADRFYRTAAAPTPPNPDLLASAVADAVYDVSGVVIDDVTARRLVRDYFGGVLDCGHPNHGSEGHDCTPFLAAPPAPAPSSDEGRDELADQYNLVLHDNGYVSANVNECTCGGYGPPYYQHESACGLEPIGRVDLSDRITQAKADGWDEGKLRAQQDVLDNRITTLSDNPYRIAAAPYESPHVYDAQPCNRAACRCTHPACGDDREDRT